MGTHREELGVHLPLCSLPPGRFLVTGGCYFYPVL